jgi:hypothetical protein
LRKDTPQRFEWRIRNLKWPKDVYQFEIDHNKQEIVLRTTNKKYYKRFDIPDMKRINLKLEESSLAWKYSNNTLIISYDKPAKIFEVDAQKQKDIAKQIANPGGSKQNTNQALAAEEGNSDCKQQ